MNRPDRRQQRARPAIGNVELLERRNLLSATALALESEWLDQAEYDHGQFDYEGLEFHALDPVEEFASADPTDLDGSSAGGLAEALVVPEYHSKLGAAVSVYLDFDGHFEASWGWFTNVTTSAFDTDNNISSFSAGELSQIQEIWQRVAEDFAPFNVNVTTVSPASFADGVSLRVAIGGSSADWYEPQGGGPAGGVAYINSFTSSSIPNVVYVFPQQLAKNAKYISEASSHEAGHGFGLDHQSAYDSSGVKTNEYNPGSGNWAPIMGNSYYASISTWHNGTTYTSTTLQDDMSVIARSANGFGYRVDDYGNTIGAASSLNVVAGAFSTSGIIAQNSDADVFSFVAGSGSATFQVSVISVGANLDSVLEIYSANGTLIASANPSASQGVSITTTLSAGTYYALVKSNGSYGRVGQYTFTGQVVAASNNLAPLVDAGTGQTIALSASATLNGTVSDDGEPVSPGSLTTTWIKLSGAGVVTFGNTSAIDTTASFSIAGTYVLQLSATDGELTTTDTVTIVVMQDGSTVTTSLREGANGYTGMTDAMIQASRAKKNYGSSTTLSVDGSPDKGALLRWDVSSLPGGVTVQSASITLRVTSATKHAFGIYEMLNGWSESSATWQQASTGSLWGSLGASLSGIDHGATSLGTVTAATTGFVTLNLNAAGVALVQQWIDSPSTNHGFIIQNYNNTASDGITFNSSESGTIAYRPTLSITYEAGSGAPVAQSAVAASPQSSGGASLSNGSSVYDVSLSPQNDLSWSVQQMGSITLRDAAGESQHSVLLPGSSTIERATTPTTSSSSLSPSADEGQTALEKNGLEHEAGESSLESDSIGDEFAWLLNEIDEVFGSGSLAEALLGG